MLTVTTEDKSLISMFLGIFLLGSAVPQHPLLPDGVFVIAHRGVVNKECAANSLDSLEETIRRGYTHIEVDVRSTLDGYPVCVHDTGLWRVAKDEAKIEALTLEQLRQRVPEEKAPSFETFCARCENRIDLMPDIKGCPEDQQGVFTERVIQAMAAHGLVENALFIGQGNKLPGLRGCGALVACSPDSEGAEPGRFVFGHAKDFSAETVKQFHDRGLKVVVSINTFHYKPAEAMVRGAEDIRRMLGFKVDGLQIDSVYDTVTPLGEVGDKPGDLETPRKES